MSLDQKIAQKFVERAKSLGYKGKKRDLFAHEYVLGAIASLDEGDMRLNSLVIDVTFRGYEAIEQYANKE